MPNTPLALFHPASHAAEKVGNNNTSHFYVKQPALPSLQEFIPYSQVKEVIQ